MHKNGTNQLKIPMTLNNTSYLDNLQVNQWAINPGQGRLALGVGG